MDPKNWHDNLLATVEQQKDKIDGRNYKFFHGERLLNMAKEVNELSDTCFECQQLKEKIENLANNLPEYLGEDMDKRREYEQAFDEVILHLSKTHGHQVAHMNKAVYSLLGIAAGVVVGWSVSLVRPEFTQGAYFSSLALGLLLGHIWGNQIDKKLNREKKNI